MVFIPLNILMAAEDRLLQQLVSLVIAPGLSGDQRRTRNDHGVGEWEPSCTSTLEDVSSYTKSNSAPTFSTTKRLARPGSPGDARVADWNRLIQGIYDSYWDRDAFNTLMNPNEEDAESDPVPGGCESTEWEGKPLAFEKSTPAIRPAAAECKYLPQCILFADNQMSTGFKNAFWNQAAFGTFSELTSGTGVKTARPGCVHHDLGVHNLQHTDQQMMECDDIESVGEDHHTEARRIGVFEEVEAKHGSPWADAVGSPSVGQRLRAILAVPHLCKAGRQPAQEAARHTRQLQTSEKAALLGVSDITTSLISNRGDGGALATIQHPVITSSLDLHNDNIKLIDDTAFAADSAVDTIWNLTAQSDASPITSCSTGTKRETMPTFDKISPPVFEVPPVGGCDGDDDSKPTVDPPTFMASPEDDNGGHFKPIQDQSQVSAPSTSELFQELGTVYGAVLKSDNSNTPTHCTVRTNVIRGSSSTRRLILHHLHESATRWRNNRRTRSLKARRRHHKKAKMSWRSKNSINGAKFAAGQPATIKAAPKLLQVVPELPTEILNDSVGLHEPGKP
ncbi:hypothetical protein BJ170DRAFT_680412 [Xylariales sp. AK1849]|nr:hypothetical protein BJ170DRAFT_680412 [Xylariales sp. AK1849]